jgi:hypothetical protein
MELGEINKIHKIHVSILLLLLLHVVFADPVCRLLLLLLQYHRRDRAIDGDEVLPPIADTGHNLEF